MPLHLQSSHRIVVDAPVDQAFMFFTPAGEERWVKGWQPTYVHPADGRTEAGMVFTTGQGDDLTIWTLVDFDPVAHQSRYLRCTPALRTGIVTVHCNALDRQRTEVWVAYALTALSAAGAQGLKDYEGAHFMAMIDGWADAIRDRLPELLCAVIR